MSAKYRKGPDGGFGWLVVLGSFLIHFIIDGIIYTSGLFLDPFMDDLNTNSTLASLVITLMTGLSLMIGNF